VGWGGRQLLICPRLTLVFGVGPSPEHRLRHRQGAVHIPEWCGGPPSAARHLDRIAAHRRVVVRPAGSDPWPGNPRPDPQPPSPIYKRLSHREHRLVSPYTRQTGHRPVRATGGDREVSRPRSSVRIVSAGPPRPPTVHGVAAAVLTRGRVICAHLSMPTLTAG